MFDLSLREPSREDLGWPLPLWADPAFMAAVARLHGVEAWHLLCHKGDQLTGLLPLFEKTSFGLRRAVSPVSAYYQGLWFNWEGGRDPNRNLLDELHVSAEVAKFLRGRYKRVSFNLTPRNPDVRGFTWAGLKAEPLYTFIHRLSEPFCLLKDERKKLRLAEGQNYGFSERFDPDSFIGLLKGMYERKQHRFGVSYPALRGWLEELNGKGLLTQFNLTHKQETVSSNIVLKDASDRTAYTIMRGTRADDLKTGASTLHSKLLVEKLAAGGEFDQLDFCGANNPEVARFKAAMGFRLALFFRIRN